MSLSTLSAMPSFRRRLIGGGGINYQNTVVVWVEAWTFWLGFIQDIRGAYVFIHFDSSAATARPRWIHASRVWPLQMWHDSPGSGQVSTTRSASAFAALRSEDGAPFCFRPVVVVDHNWLLPICYIRTDTAGTTEGMPSDWSEVPLAVDECQVIARLPVNEPPLLDKTQGLLYTKHLIPLHGPTTGVQWQLALHALATDTPRLVHELRQALNRQPVVGLKWLREPCRFHLHLGEDGCTVIIVGQRTDPASLQATQQILVRILDRYLAAPAGVASLLPANNIIAASAHRMESQPVLSEIDAETDATGPTGGLGQLSPELLLAVLAGLDVRSQATAQRVCGLWQVIVQDARCTEHLSIVAEELLMVSDECDDNRCYLAARMLSRALAAGTRSVCVIARHPAPPADGGIDWEAVGPYWEMLHLVSHLAAVLRIRLPWLVGQSFQTECEWRLRDALNHRLGVFAEHDAVQRLLLRDWRVCGGFTSSLSYVLYDDNRTRRPSLTRLPKHERRFLRPLAPGEQLALDRMDIRIGALRINYVDGWEHVLSRFMWGVDAHCAPLSEDVYRQVAAVHERWQCSLQYPDEWQTIRRFLTLCNGFHADDGSPRVWDEVDLRRMDVRQLSKLALLGIAAVFGV